MTDLQRNLDTVRSECPACLDEPFGGCKLHCRACADDPCGECNAHLSYTTSTVSMSEAYREVVLRIDGRTIVCGHEGFGVSSQMSPRIARRLAVQLLEAADWAER